jgi:ribonuclease HI
MNNTKDLYILEKVKGHGKDAFNRYVDKLAKSELSSIITN